MTVQLIFKDNLNCRFANIVSLNHLIFALEEMDYLPKFTENLRAVRVIY